MARGEGVAVIADLYRTKVSEWKHHGLRVIRRVHRDLKAKLCVTLCSIDVDVVLDSIMKHAGEGRDFEALFPELVREEPCRGLGHAHVVAKACHDDSPLCLSNSESHGGKHEVIRVRSSVVAEDWMAGEGVVAECW